MMYLAARRDLPETTYNRLDKALHDIEAGRYWVLEKRML